MENAENATGGIFRVNALLPSAGPTEVSKLADVTAQAGEGDESTLAVIVKEISARKLQAFEEGSRLCKELAGTAQKHKPASCSGQCFAS